MQSPLSDRLSRVFDHAVVRSFAHDTTLTSPFWIAITLATGGAK